MPYVKIVYPCRNENTGEGVGAKMAKALDGKNYQLVITGHSLGAGTAALVGLKLKARFPGRPLLHVNWTHRQTAVSVAAFSGDCCR